MFHQCSEIESIFDCFLQMRVHWTSWRTCSSSKTINSIGMFIMIIALYMVVNIEAFLCKLQCLFCGRTICAIMFNVKCIVLSFFLYNALSWSIFSVLHHIGYSFIDLPLKFSSFKSGWWHRPVIIFGKWSFCGLDKDNVLFLQFIPILSDHISVLTIMVLQCFLYQFSSVWRIHNLVICPL